MPQPNQTMQRIRQLMAQRNINQSDLALRMQVSRAIVSNWLSGSRTPRMENMQAILQILGATWQDLQEQPTTMDPEVRTIVNAYRAAHPMTQRAVLDVLHIDPTTMRTKD